MCIPTGCELERLFRLAVSWRQEYFAEISRLLREDDTRDAESRDTFKASPAHPNPASAELAGKIETNCKSGNKLRSQIVQVEAVMKMFDADFDAQAISAKRRALPPIPGSSAARYEGPL
jgi:hypothetical protein